MSAANAKVNFFFDKAAKWQPELLALRKICLALGLNEELKWGCPCYTRDESNIVLIHAFKDYCALLFFKGALIKDLRGILIQQTENVQSARQMRFTNLSEITKLKTTITKYIAAAIAVEKAGLKVALKKTSEFKMPAELQTQLAKNPPLKSAFAALTPGRQRAYLLHFSAPKQAKTRIARIEKCTPRILDGFGLND
ncbi:MAG: YdeI/OmpD-associated family protein [Spirochaetes bacterium]|nr:YdeI/OmpD-associated family protein [Spirochaetota bacterium]